jgi:sugar phosphate isomerase/epimerase
MSISPLPISYCTNVHRGTSLAEVERGLREYAAPIQQQVGRPVGVGLWLSDAVARELLSGDGIDRLRDLLTTHALTCYTLNAFPFGDFHGPRVKERVYTPAWDQPARLQYTANCASILAALLPTGTDGSISTLPLGFVHENLPPVDIDAAMGNLIQLSRQLHQLEQQTGKTIRLAVEPEPLCLLETTAQTIEFFHRFFASASQSTASEAIVREHIGVCFDVCHQAVEFEDPEQGIAALQQAGVRVNKLHLSSAIRLPHPAANGERRLAMKRYVEARYLHQTLAQLPDGQVVRTLDLDPALIDNPPADFAAAIEWRVHFHVPIDAASLGPLQTTFSHLPRAIRAVALLPHAPHLEVETYTWEVLPGQPGVGIVHGIAAELHAAERLAAAAQNKPHSR